MSDVPELDRLLEEEANIRRNRAWDKRDRFFNLTLACMILSVLICLPASLLLGEIGIFISTALFFAAILPALAGAAFELLNALLTPPPRRDPTKRYNYK